MTDVLAEAVGAGRVFGTNGSKVVALKHATCRIERGDRIALVGPSGSGKSTLLHLLAGLDLPTSGTVRWPALGERDTLRPEKVSFVFQTESLLAPLTVLENIEVPRLLIGSKPSEARADAALILRALDLVELSDKLPEEISGGQAQRAAVARSLVTQPELILADEPTGQLDHQTAKHLLSLLLRRIKGTDTALIIATHDPLIASRMETQWTMDHGVLR
ncbi:MAG: ABC-type antimicrobial peptide transport system, ATPase component [Gemmatimonadales bacterium]|jgi:putative ABC transport system ATP-binding protein/lipoprotein-releasing system ATP-binding protein|nr:ABC-type antimicrobial peptide transport system, ATPase component [Gemmatimonadales bacterium]